MTIFRQRYLSSNKMAEDSAWTKQKIKSKIEGNELDLSLCGISKVPVQNMLPFTKVSLLDLSCNKINSLPDTFTKLVNLVSIDLSKNALSALPNGFGDLQKLKKLDLLQNNIQSLPLSFRKLKDLQWLDLKANPIQENLQNIVGDCLKPEECQRCAINIVAYYEKEYNEVVEEEKRARKLEEIRLDSLRKEEDKVRQRKREEKKKRVHEQKLQKALEKQRQDNDVINTDEGENRKETKKDLHQSSRSCYVTCFYLLIVIALFVAICLFTLYRVDSQEFRTLLDEFTKELNKFVNKIFGKKR